MHAYQMQPTVEPTSAAAPPRVTIAYGDGIGPEIMDATLRILAAGGANFTADHIDIGEQVYLGGHSSGIAPESWDVLRRNRVFLKGPITTPTGTGYKSLNVTIRKSLGLFANVRPCQSFHPYVATHFPQLDVVIIRENEEDLYAGIEHQQTQDVVQCLKLITRPGCERIVRYAFEYARAYGRRKVTCLVKDNIMKLTDGLFRRVFTEIGEEYPELEKQVQIVDIGSARLAARPGQYDVVVTSNLYGDIVSDIVAEVAGSVGLAGSANVGAQCAMFEAIHGSAPDIAGQDLANPSGLLQAAVQMLIHLGQTEAATRIHHAWLCTLEDGIHTADIFQEGFSSSKVGTQAFADAVIDRLGRHPRHFAPLQLTGATARIHIPEYVRPSQTKTLVGMDVFLDWPHADAQELGQNLETASAGYLKLKMITNRGVKVYPDGLPETFCTDHWRCRFVALDAHTRGAEPHYPAIDYAAAVGLLQALHQQGFDVVKTENLYQFDGQRGFSLGQGE